MKLARTCLLASAATAALLVGCGRKSSRTSTTTLAVRVSDATTHQPLGARVLLIDHAGKPLHIGTIDLYGKRQAASACVFAPGVLGSWDGLILADGSADIPIGADDCTPSPAIPYGSYTVWAWRGPEYDKWEGHVDIPAGGNVVALNIPLARAWTPHGALAADLHVHAAASNDSHVPNPQRVTAQVAAGVQVIGLSDHNNNGDLDAEIADLKLGNVVTSIASNELSSEAAHVGVYPVIVDANAPQHGGPPAALLEKASASELLRIARSLPGQPIVQVNHPRFRVTSMFDSLGWNGTSWPPPFPLDFDAVEVLNGHTAFNVSNDRRIDEAVRDFYTFTDHGFLVTPLGNSDTHHLNGVHDALCRNYVFVDDPRVAPFDEAGFINALRHRRVEATSGPWLDVEVKTSDTASASVGAGQALQLAPVAAQPARVWVDVTLQQANFVHADAIRIMVGTPTGPSVAQTISVVASQPNHWSGWITVGNTDTWLGVDAGGDTPLPIELTGTYQIEKKRTGVTPFALIAPILLDVDGDGRWRRGSADVDLTIK